MRERDERGNTRSRAGCWCSRMGLGPRCGVLTRLTPASRCSSRWGWFCSVAPGGNCYFEPYFNTGLYSSLFAACAVPRLWGRRPHRHVRPPFHGSEILTHPAFARVNLILSGFWEILFRGRPSSPCILRLVPGRGAPALCLIVGLPVTMVLPKLYRRLLRQQTRETPEPLP